MKITPEMLKSWTPEDFWNAYKSTVYKGPLIPEQEKECWNAFFAGLHATFDFFREVSEKLSEDEAMQVLDRFDKSVRLTARAMNPTGDQ